MIRLAAVAAFLMQFSPESPGKSIWMELNWVAESNFEDVGQMPGAEPIYWLAMIASCWSWTAIYVPILFLICAQARAVQPGWIHGVAGFLGLLMWLECAIRPTWLMSHLSAKLGDKTLPAMGILLYLLTAGYCGLLSRDRVSKGGAVFGFGVFAALGLTIAWTLLAAFVFCLSQAFPAMLSTIDIVQFLIGWVCAVLMLLGWVLWWKAVILHERASIPVGSLPDTTFK